MFRFTELPDLCFMYFNLRLDVENLMEMEVSASEFFFFKQIFGPLNQLSNVTEDVVNSLGNSRSS